MADFKTLLITLKYIFVIQHKRKMSIIVTPLADCMLDNCFHLIHLFMYEHTFCVYT